MKHLTVEQRYTISALKAQGHKRKDIALAIGKDRSVISRELKRNCDGRSGEYKAGLAQRKYANRQKNKPRHQRFTQQIQTHVDDLLREDLSPEQIVGVSKKLDIECVSVERIYQHVWEDKKGKGDLHTHLRRKGRKYRKRGSSKDSRGIIKDRVSIGQRPDIVEKRSRFGDLEVDLIIGKNHKEVIVTVNDRASGVLKMEKAASKKATVVRAVINKILEEWIPYLHTITSDNGKEFADHENIAETLNIDYYFAHPYHSWERGSNENLNGLIRQYITKKTDFRTLSHEYIRSIENKLNNRPRKRLGFETPIFVMNQLLFNHKVAFVT